MGDYSQIGVCGVGMGCMNLIISEECLKVGEGFESAKSGTKETPPNCTTPRSVLQK